MHEPRSYSNLPVFGPTDPFGDEEHEPEVIVRVDFLMAREQIATALGIAWAEIAGDREPESLTVAETRHEVEAWLSVQAFFALDQQMERDALRVFPPEQLRVLQVLAAAVDRAYPPAPAPPAPMQGPRYADGMVILQTVDHGEVTVPEPAWCTGHGWQPCPHLADVTHNSVRVKAGAMTEGHGWVDILQARISHAPYGERPEPRPVVSVELDVQQDFTAEDVPKVAQGLRVAAMRLEKLAAEALHLRGAAS